MAITIGRNFPRRLACGGPERGLRLAKLCYSNEVLHGDGLSKGGCLGTITGTRSYPAISRTHAWLHSEIEHSRLARPPTAPASRTVS